MYDLSALSRDLGAVSHTLDRLTVLTKSRDGFGISPILRQALAGKSADIVVSPAGKADLVQVVKAAVRHRIPITPRGGGTANYGQSVPLQGGILLDMTRFSGVLSAGAPGIRALAGTLMSEVDAVARKSGWELRLHPSTRAKATLAGYIAGGSVGMGSCMWGMLRDRGNIAAIEVMSVEAEPRTLELRGRDVNLVHHAYGTNAIITEIEMPASPAWKWIEAIVAFPDYLQEVRFGLALTREVAIVKKLVSLQEWPVPRLMVDLKAPVPEGHSMANCMISEPTFDAFADMVTEHGGSIVSKCGEGEGPYHEPLYEFAFGHGLLQVQKSDRRFTALQGMFPGHGLYDAIEAVHRELAGTMPMRMEVFWSQAEVVAMGSPFIIFENEEQMGRLCRMLQSHGVIVANNHSFGVREVGIKTIDERDVEFKKQMDPHNLLNPGKLDFSVPAATSERSSLPTSGWAQRWKKA